MVLRKVESAFGCNFVENNWSDDNWDNYQFNLRLQISIKNKALMEGRKLNLDEKKFINELEQRNQEIRETEDYERIQKMDKEIAEIKRYAFKKGYVTDKSWECA